MSLKLIARQFLFGLRRQRTLILAFLSIWVVVAVFVRPWPFSDSPAVDWFSGWSVVNSLATLSVAILVWFGEVRQDWEANLPKRLDVDFVFDGKTVMTVRNATLTSESDLRTWAQQLGAQIIGGRRLDIGPSIVLPPAENDVPKQVRRYSIQTPLTSLAEEVVALRKEHEHEHEHGIALLDPSVINGRHVTIVSPNEL